MDYSKLLTSAELQTINIDTLSIEQKKILETRNALDKIINWNKIKVEIKVKNNKQLTISDERKKNSQRFLEIIKEEWFNKNKYSIINNSVIDKIDDKYLDHLDDLTINISNLIKEFINDNFSKNLNFNLKQIKANYQYITLQIKTDNIDYNMINEFLNLTKTLNEFIFHLTNLKWDITDLYEAKHILIRKLENIQRIIKNIQSI